MGARSRGRARAGVERFLFISLVRAQISATTAHLVKEQDEPAPTDTYGRSNLAAELALRAAGVPSTILRPVAIYGPHPKGNFRLIVQLALSPLPLPFAASAIFLVLSLATIGNIARRRPQPAHLSGAIHDTARGARASDRKPIRAFAVGFDCN